MMGRRSTPRATGTVLTASSKELPSWTPSGRKNFLQMSPIWKCGLLEANIKVPMHTVGSGNEKEAVQSVHASTPSRTGVTCGEEIPERQGFMTIRRCTPRATDTAVASGAHACTRCASGAVPGCWCSQACASFSDALRVLQALQQLIVLPYRRALFSSRHCLQQKCSARMGWGSFWMERSGKRNIKRDQCPPSTHLPGIEPSFRQLVKSEAQPICRVETRTRSEGFGRFEQPGNFGFLSTFGLNFEQFGSANVTEPIFGPVSVEFWLGSGAEPNRG
ncbi:hypothetical protein DFH06DRAFT_1152390 [Mycena polygramma]|nr:hypothetical protein DFH06DRAFT_1152390 [Mycena polygramma]